MSQMEMLSHIAQFDDVCRYFVTKVEKQEEDETYSEEVIETVKKNYRVREAVWDKQRTELRLEIANLNKEIRKLNRQLTESRAALAREADEKKNIARERRSLLENIKRVRELLAKTDGYSDNDTQRRQVMDCLEAHRVLSPIQSDDSDDCLSGLDYDITEEDILEENEKSAREHHQHYDDHNGNSEQPTLLYRYIDKNSDDNENQPLEQLRRSTRRSAGNLRASGQSRKVSEAMAAARDKVAGMLDSDSNGTETDDNAIETVRQQLNRLCEEKEQLASAPSTPSLRSQFKSATLSAKSAANLMKTISSISTPVPNTMKPHSFIRKKSFKPNVACVPCGGKISFYGNLAVCESCSITCHPECKEKCPLPCVKITAPDQRSKSKKILISNYVDSDTVPKVPALIVHCCNVIEREDNITTEGLYRVVASTKDVEELQQNILKSKSGMPNLSKTDVHLLTGVVKRFLQTLDESLITTCLWPLFAEAVKMDNELETITHLSFYFSHDLPAANRDTLAYLMQHFHSIAKHSSVNLMPVENLAKTLAPTIIGNSCRNPDHSTILSENKIQVQIMNALFRIEEDFWAKFVPRHAPPTSPITSLGSRLLNTPSSSSRPRTRASSRMGSTLPTPKLKPLFS